MQNTVCCHFITNHIRNKRDYLESVLVATTVLNKEESDPRSVYKPGV